MTVYFLHYQQCFFYIFCLFILEQSSLLIVIGLLEGFSILLAISKASEQDNLTDAKGSYEIRHRLRRS
jgi:hypothetical protein